MPGDPPSDGEVCSECSGTGALTPGQWLSRAAVPLVLLLCIAGGGALWAIFGGGSGIGNGAAAVCALALLISIPWLLEGGGFTLVLRLIQLIRLTGGTRPGCPVCDGTGRVTRRTSRAAWLMLWFVITAVILGVLIVILINSGVIDLWS